MSHEANGVEVLGSDECFALLGAAPFGRVIFTEGALPAVEPVSFVLDGQDVIIATDRGSKLVASAARGTVVAFQTDDYDGATGWSVTLVGQTRPVRSAGEIGWLSGLPMGGWPGRHDHFIRIHGVFVSGQRVHSALRGATT